MHEKITPFAIPSSAPYTPFIFRGEYKFEPMQVDSGPAGKIPIPIVGSLFRGLTNTVADVFVALARGTKVSTKREPIDLSDIDFSIMKSIQIKELQIYIVPNSVTKPRTFIGRIYNWILMKKAKLDFIKSIKIFITSESEQKLGHSYLLASYTINEQHMSPSKNLIQFKIHNKNSKMLEMLKDDPSLILIPKVKIKSIPNRFFQISGLLKYELVVYSPFLDENERTATP